MTRYAVETPEIRIPSGKLFAGPSRFSNIYAPAPEVLMLAEEVVVPQSVEIRIGFERKSKSLSELRRVGRKARLMQKIEYLREGPTLNMGSQMVYDARWVFNGNVSLLVGHHIANLGFVKRTTGFGQDSIMIGLELDSPPLSHAIFNMLGYETFETNRHIGANLVEVDVDPLIPYPLIDYVGELEPKSLRLDTPSKIFISRLGTRKLQNEAEIIGLLGNQGYELCYFEDLDVLDQWSYIKNAKRIAAIHGAALGYLPVKSSTDGKNDFGVIEMFSPGLVVDCFRKTTAILNGFWVGCRGRITSEFVRGVEESLHYKQMEAEDFYLHPEVLEKALVEHSCQY